jgi:aminopeptidase S
MLEYADCPYRAAGLEATHCGPLNDDFEAARGWDLNTTGSGGWDRANPEPTSTAAGKKQLGKTSSGEAALVSGALAGAGANANDLDGTTTAESPPIDLGSGSWTVKFRFAFAHDAASSADDRLRLSVVQGGSATPMWTASGKPSERNATWTTKTFSLSAYAGQTIRLRFIAVDGAADNLVEAAIDNVRVYQTP